VTKAKTYVMAGAMVPAIEMVAREGQQDARGGSTTSGPMLIAISPARRPLNALSKRIMQRVGAVIVFAELIAAAKGQPILPPVHLHPCDCTEASTQCSCDCKVPRRRRAIAQEDVVGTWFISLSQEGAGASQNLVTFHAGGTMTSASGDFGVWAESNGTYGATTDTFTFDQHGTVTGRRRTSWSVAVTTLDELQASFVVDLIGLDGTITPAVGSGTAAGCRVPLPLQFTH
jgi:hypothetical protein